MGQVPEGIAPVLFCRRPRPRPRGERRPPAVAGGSAAALWAKGVQGRGEGGSAAALEKDGSGEGGPAGPVSAGGEGAVAALTGRGRAASEQGCAPFPGPRAAFSRRRERPRAEKSRRGGVRGGSGALLCPPLLPPSLEGQVSRPHPAASLARPGAFPPPPRASPPSPLSHKPPASRSRSGAWKCRRTRKHRGGTGAGGVRAVSLARRSIGARRRELTGPCWILGEGSPAGCCVLGGQRALTSARWAVVVSLGCCAEQNQAAKPQVHLLPDPPTLLVWHSRS
nr:collagen alpha-1(II) chain [Taeniopygia guttata]